jgi:hypothetical protein
MSDDALYMWTVYEHPRDAPEKYVARLWRIERGKTAETDTVILRDTLDEMRIVLARMNLYRLERDPLDDPVIVETWL